MREIDERHGRNRIVSLMYGGPAWAQLYNSTSLREIAMQRWDACSVDCQSADVVRSLRKNPFWRSLVIRVLGAVGIALLVEAPQFDQRFDAKIILNNFTPEL